LEREPLEVRATEDQFQGLSGRNGLSPIPVGLPQRYSKHSPLTVLFRPQVSDYSCDWLGMGPSSSFLCQMLELSTWAIVFVITIMALLIILAAVVLWDLFR
jgi:hypothetical protein